MVAATDCISSTSMEDHHLHHPQQHAQHCWIDSIASPISILNRNQLVIGWNSHAAKVTKIGFQQIIQQPLSSFLQPESVDLLQQAVQEMEKGLKQNMSMQIAFARPEGDQYHQVQVAARLDENSGSYCGVILFFVDKATKSLEPSTSSPVVILDHSNSPQHVSPEVSPELDHSDDAAAMAKELQTMLDTANVPIFGIDCGCKINEWNLFIAEISGYEKENVLGQSLVDIIAHLPAMQTDLEQVLQDALNGTGKLGFQVEFKTSSNEIKHMLLNVTTRRNAAGDIIGAVCWAHDITEGYHRFRALGGVAAELRQLIDTANAPIFGIDVEGNINEWNKRTAEITGYSKEEAFDEPLVERFIAPEMKEKVEEILSKALQGSETSDYELEFISKSGEAVFLLVNATTRRDPENSIVGVVGVAQDVTEDRKHREALRQMEYLRASQEAKVETERNMTAYFAHELRNPLGAIDSALNAMPDNLNEEAKSLVSGMQLCTGFMSSIMNNLLDVRKMEEGKMVLLKAPISLKKIVSNVHKMLLPSVRPGVEFTKKSDTQERDWIIGDSHRVQQVITNVVTNAIKYTVNGSICLSVGWEGDMVKFEVEDTGPGIPKNQQGKLFQRFVQRGGAPGTGLGLAIAKHLVDLNGGSIQFNSDPSIKAGTTCVVYMKLPICEEPKAIVEESSGVIEEPLSILIIDDIKMNRVMLKRRIIKGIAPNAVIKEAATGEAALEICGDRSFDVIVVDQYMEEAGGIMVGTDVVFAMRRMRMDSVIIGCSGNDMGNQFAEAGADFVWQKPIPNNQQIIQQIRTSMSERRPNSLQ